MNKLLILLLIGCVCGDTIKYQESSLFYTSEETLTNVELVETDNVGKRIYLKFSNLQTGHISSINCNNITLWQDNNGNPKEIECRYLGRINKDEKKLNINPAARLVGGISYANVVSDDLEKYLESKPERLLGIKFGIEREGPNGTIIGITYTNRGFSFDENQGAESMELNWKVNYLTGYIIKSIPMKSLDVLIGIEVGYFFNGTREMKECAFGYGCMSEEEDYDTEDWEEKDGNVIDVGPVFGFRFPISESAYLNGTYYWGLVNWYDKDDSTDMVNRGFQFYLSFML